MTPYDRTYKYNIDATADELAALAYPALKIWVEYGLHDAARLMGGDDRIAALLRTIAEKLDEETGNG